MIHSTMLKTGSLAVLILSTASTVFAGGGCQNSVRHEFGGYGLHSRSPWSAPSHIAVPTYRTSGYRHTNLEREVVCSTHFGCELAIEPVRLANWGTFTCARLVSTPAPDSCLAGLGLVKGDLITRINGVRVTDTRHLNCSLGEFRCRYIRIRDGVVREALVNVGTEAALPPQLAGDPPLIPTVVAGLEIAPPPSELPAIPDFAVAPLPPLEAPPAPSAPSEQ